MRNAFCHLPFHSPFSTSSWRNRDSFWSEPQETAPFHKFGISFLCKQNGIRRLDEDVAGKTNRQHPLLGSSPAVGDRSSRTDAGQSSALKYSAKPCPNMVL